jgi:hypothetical protein
MTIDSLKVVLVGLPIIKDNATSLGIKIFHEVLEPLILNQMHAKFSYDFIKETINTYLKKDEILTLIAQEYKIKPLSTYKLESQIQAQISKAYFNGQEGIISLIKNKKVGKVGKGVHYCTIEEAKEAKLTEEDLDLKKLWNELMPFIDRNSLPKKECKEKVTRIKKIKQSIKLPNVDETKSEVIIKTINESIKDSKEYMQECMDEKVEKIIEQHKSFYEE